MSSDTQKMCDEEVSVMDMTLMMALVALAFSLVVELALLEELDKRFNTEGENNEVTQG